MRTSETSRFIKLSPWLFISVLKLERFWFLSKNELQKNLNFIDLKIKIFRDFQVCVLSFLPKNESLKIMETPQKFHNTDIWESIFKNIDMLFKFNQTQTDTLTLLVYSFWHLKKITVHTWIGVRATNPGWYVLYYYYYYYYYHFYSISTKWEYPKNKTKKILKYKYNTIVNSCCKEPEEEKSTFS